MNKIALVILDGLGDRPIPELNNLTPLEAATTPNLDRFAARGISGLLHVLGVGLVPGSDVAHLTIFGYDINKYYRGRGPIEAAGLGVKLEDGDVALRANFGTVDNGMKVVDRRAGRINHVEELVKDVDGMEIDGVKFIVKPGTGHRAAVIMRGKGLSDHISDPDSHSGGEVAKNPEALDSSAEAAFTAQVLSKFLVKSHEILERSPFNQKRVANHQLPGNYLLVRGAGKHNSLPSFEEKYGLRACCIAGAGLYKGVAAYAGMDVLETPGATGQADTDVRAKFSHAVECLKGDYDFAFIHVKATDTLSHDGDYMEKKAFIEKVDAAAELLWGLPEGTLLILTGDHSTSCSAKNHCGDPVPVFMYATQDIRTDQVTQFGERPCMAGGLGHIMGMDIMMEAMNLLNRNKLIGA